MSGVPAHALRSASPSDARSGSVSRWWLRRRVGRRLLPATSMAISLALHVSMALVGAVFVYRAALRPVTLSEELTMELDAPGLGLPTSASSTVVSAGGAIGVSAAAQPVASGGSGLSTALSQPQIPLLGMANSSLLIALANAIGQSSRDGVAGAQTLPGGSGVGGTGLGGFSGLGGVGGVDGVLVGSSSAFVTMSGLEASAQSTMGVRGVSFAGLGASTARTVVYAVDCSGPMVTSLPMVLEELERSVAKLGSTQKFGVVLFRSGGRGVESFAPVLIRATPSAKARLATWLRASEPSGRSTPLAGLETALALKPDAVFLLSRSIERSGGGVWDGGLGPTLARIDQINPEISPGRRATIIQTIQFIDDDTTGTMQAIAARHGPGGVGRGGIGAGAGAGAGGGGAASRAGGYRVVRRSEELAQP